jgi:predicted RNase H-like nuclease (RuvC/YqgF family)
MTDYARLREAFVRDRQASNRMLSQRDQQIAGLERRLAAKITECEKLRTELLTCQETLTACLETGDTA